jgi:hypothetical protein
MKRLKLASIVDHIPQHEDFVPESMFQLCEPHHHGHTRMGPTQDNLITIPTSLLDLD